MRRMSVALAVMLALTACSRGDGDADSGNSSTTSGNQVNAIPGPDGGSPSNPELRVAEPDRKAYADLFSCRFQLQVMETRSMDVTDAFADKVAAEYKANPDAFKECLRTLQQKQAAGAPPGGPSPVAPSDVRTAPGTEPAPR